MTFAFASIVILILGINVAFGEESAPAERYWWRRGNWTTSWDPSNAAIAGHQDENQIGPTLVYICRATHENQKIPGTYLADVNQCAITYQGAELVIPEGFQTLKEDSPNAYNWFPSQNGQLVNGSVVAGFSSNFEPYFICRARIEDLEKNSIVMYAGKLQPSIRACSVPWAGKEKLFENYEILQDPEYAPVEDVKYTK